MAVGTKAQESIAWFDEADHIWKTWDTSWFEGGIPFTERMPRLGAILSAQLFAIQNWIRPTSEEDFAPASDIETVKNALGRVRKKRKCVPGGSMPFSEWVGSPAGKYLAGLARRGVWPTPLALQITLDMSGTPTVGAQCLVVAVAVNHLWATNLPTTPSAGDSWTDLLMSDPLPEHLPQGEKHETLNPAWVELLMGFPPGWTYIDESIFNGK